VNESNSPHEPVGVVPRARAWQRPAADTEPSQIQATSPTKRRVQDTCSASSAVGAVPQACRAWQTPAASAEPSVQCSASSVQPASDKRTVHLDVVTLLMAQDSNMVDTHSSWAQHGADAARVREVLNVEPAIAVATVPCRKMAGHWTLNTGRWVPHLPPAFAMLDEPVALHPQHRWQSKHPAPFASSVMLPGAGMALRWQLVSAMPELLAQHRQARVASCSHSPFYSLVLVLGTRTTLDLWQASATPEHLLQCSRHHTLPGQSVPLQPWASATHTCHSRTNRGRRCGRCRMCCGPCGGSLPPRHAYVPIARGTLDQGECCHT